MQAADSDPVDPAGVNHGRQYRAWVSRGFIFLYFCVGRVWSYNHVPSLLLQQHLQQARRAGVRSLGNITAWRYDIDLGWCLSGRRKVDAISESCLAIRDLNEHLVLLQ